MSTGTRTATRTVARKISAPVRSPIRHVVTHYATFFEDLIHAVKSELVEKLDKLDHKIVTGNQSLADQLAVQSAAIRKLQAEVERLQAIAERSPNPELDISDISEAAAPSSTA